VVIDDDPGGTKFTPTVLLYGSVYLADNVDQDHKQAFMWGVSQVRDTPTKGTDILVMNKITDLSADILQQTYDDSRFLAIVNPKADELKAFSDANDWIDIDTDNVNDSVLIYCFNRTNRNYYVGVPQSSEENDPLLHHRRCCKQQ
jgi:hypothetical protein